jgi:thiol-disulfide isomerase/thioredoxin
MRQLLAAAVLVSLVGMTPAQNAPKQPDAPKAGEKPGLLKVGDPAPPLKATKWLQGTEVKEFAPGKVYVVEFWATWCGPCIVMMPHMSDTQAEYKNRGLTVIGFSAKDPNNSAEKVSAFVEKRGPKLGYTFAYADDRETYGAWMTAAQRNGIPCCFVVDKQGKIAYIGHPMYLDEVLPKVVAGTWKAEEGAAELKMVEKEVNDLFKVANGMDAEAGLKAFAEFDAKHPGLAKIPYFNAARIGMRLKLKKYDEARKISEDILADAIKHEDPMALRTLAGVLKSPDAKDQKELTDLATKATEALQKLSN